MIVYFRFKLYNKNTSAAMTVKGASFPSPQESNLEKGVETSNSATKWKGNIDFNLRPESEWDAEFNFRPKIKDGVRWLNPRH